MVYLYIDNSEFTKVVIVKCADEETAVGLVPLLKAYKRIALLTASEVLALTTVNSIVMIP